MPKEETMRTAKRLEACPQATVGECCVGTKSVSLFWQSPQERFANTQG